MSWRILDQQMAVFAERLEREVKVPPAAAYRLATTIAADIRVLPLEAKAELRDSTPVAISDRLAEVLSFQSWMDVAHTVRSPSITRAQVITQNYICFVYLPESLFRVLAKHCPSGSAARKCAQFLSNNPVRSFRNAVAHANWTYRQDFGALVYWARKGSEPDDPLQRFEVEQDELTFWQSLSRCLAYASLTNLSEANPSRQS
jgi:hypothetical protein